jgi:hypothetical protein
MGAITHVFTRTFPPTVRVPAGSNVEGCAPWNGWERTFAACASYVA